MKIPITRTIQFLSTLVFAWPVLTLAAIPNGVMEFQLLSDNQIYDISHFSDCETVNELGASVTLCGNIDMVPDGKGKHSGSATLEFSGDITGTLVGPASASVKGTVGGEGKAKLMFAGTGNISNGVETFPTDVKVSCKGTISSSGFFASTCSLRVSIEGAGSGSAKAELSDQLNGLLWTLTIDVNALDEKKFAGTGTDSLGYAYTVSGKYSSKSDTSKVKATGAKNTSSNGVKVNLNNLTAGGSAAAKLKVQGYKGTPEVQANSTPSSGTPNILGTYTGTGTAANTNCTDPDINTTFNTSVLVEVLNQDGSAFTGRIIEELVFQGVTFSGVDNIDGSITNAGMISGTMVGTFEATSSTGTFTGQLSGNTLTIDSVSHDTAGETCTTTASLTATQ